MSRSISYLTEQLPGLICMWGRFSIKPAHTQPKPLKQFSVASETV